MSYAVRNDGKGWRAVTSAVDCTTDETWSATQPAPSLDKQKSDKSASVKAALSSIDSKGARGSREVALALVAGTTPDPVTVTTLSGYEAQAVTLRAKLDAIDAATTQAELDAVEL